MSVIALDRIGFSYLPAEPILSDVSVSIVEGESIAVMGPSGSGKTTLLAVAGLLLHPSRGRVLIADEEVPQAESQRRLLRTQQFGWVFQTMNSLPRRSALDNVVLGLLGLGLCRSEVEPRCREALTDLGLGQLADRSVEELSGGELQRVGIARAIVRRPRLIIADEPTGQLDSRNSALVIDALLSASGYGTAVLLATHDPAVARRCDRVLHLEAGHLH